MDRTVSVTGSMSLVMGGAGHFVCYCHGLEMRINVFCGQLGTFFCVSTKLNIFGMVCLNSETMYVNRGRRPALSNPVPVNLSPMPLRRTVPGSGTP